MPDPSTGKRSTQPAQAKTPTPVAPQAARPVAGQTQAAQVQKDIAGLSLGQQQARLQPATTSLSDSKARVRRKVIGGGGWYDKVSDFTLNLARWKSRNWTKYIGATGGNYYVAWTEGQFTNAVTSLVGTVVGTGLGLAAGAGLGALIGSAVPGLGTVVGAAVGFLVSLIIGGIMTALGNDASMATVDATLRQAASEIVETTGQFAGQYDSTLQGVRSERDSAVAGVEAATSTEALSQWETWVDGETALVQTSVPVTDESLYQGLLADWVLQHAGDEEDQNKETNSASYDKNREAVFGVAANDNLVRKDLFAHQAKYEWGRLGVVDGGAGRLLANEARVRGRHMSAAAIDSKYSGESFTFRGTNNAEATIAKIEDDFGGEMAPQARQQIRDDDFTLTCTLDLTNWDGSVYVDHFNYFIDLQAPMPRGYSRTGRWSVSPD